MNIKPAKISDVGGIYNLISLHAREDKMLFRSTAYIYENLQMFDVAEMDGQTAGCCALQVIWKDLAEIKSLTVAAEYKNKGIGKALVQAAIENARNLGVQKVFALTLEPAFFEKMGFSKVEMNTLPMKVWSDCAKCPKQDYCDEIAVEIQLWN